MISKALSDRMFVTVKQYDEFRDMCLGFSEGNRPNAFTSKEAGMIRQVYLFLFYLQYLFSIHEKANCIAIFWTGRPHSLGSCYFRGVWATCLPHKGGDVPSSALPKDTTSELAGLFSTTSPKCRATSREAVDTIF